MNKRPTEIMLIFIYQIFQGVIYSLSTLLVLFLTFLVLTQALDSSNEGIPLVIIYSLLGFFFILSLVWAIAYFITAYGTFNAQKWSKTASLILAGFDLLNFPIGTVVSILIFIYLLDQKSLHYYENK